MNTSKRINRHEIVRFYRYIKRRNRREKYKLVAKFTDSISIKSILLVSFLTPKPEYELVIDKHYSIYRILDHKQLLYIHLKDGECVKICCYNEVDTNDWDLERYT